MKQCNQRECLICFRQVQTNGKKNYIIFIALSKLLFLTFMYLRNVLSLLLAFVVDSIEKHNVCKDC